MAAAAFDRSTLDAFRSAWIQGHLDYQRAAEMLEDARRAWHGVREAVDSDRDEELRAMQDSVDRAAEHLAAIEAVLGDRFDRFCG